MAHAYPEGYAREGHGCAVVGKSQLLTWGGVQWPNSAAVFGVKDVLPQGLGIFDMNKLDWKEVYDSDAAAYKAHERMSSA